MGRKSIEAVNVIRILAYVFILFFVVPTVILILVISIIPVAILVTALTAALMILGYVPWTPPEITVAAETLTLALYGATGEKGLLEVWERLREYRFDKLKLDEDKKIEKYVEENRVGDAVREYARALFRLFTRGKHEWGPKK